MEKCVNPQDVETVFMGIKNRACKTLKIMYI